MTGMKVVIPLPVVATCDIRSPNEPFENTFPRFSRLAGETVGE